MTEEDENETELCIGSQGFHSEDVYRRTDKKIKNRKRVWLVNNATNFDKNINCGSGLNRNTVDSDSTMSKGDVIRGFVTERLAVASQEILAVVDKIVAGYEEEASGFRQEIERQRRQLEELLQPEVRPKAGRSLKGWVC